MKTTYIIFSLIFIGFGCSGNHPDKEDNLVLYADREAPLGWLYLKLYKDGNFDFVSKGIRIEDTYPGTYLIKGDSIFLTFRDSIPKAADDTLLINGNGLSYQNTHGGLSISLNKLNNAN